MNDGSLMDVTALKRNARNRIEAMHERSSVNVKFESRSSPFTFTRDNSPVKCLCFIVTHRYVRT